MFKWFAQWSSYSVSELTPWLLSTLRELNSGHCQTAVTVLNQLPINQLYTKVCFARDTKSVGHILEQEHTIFWNNLWLHKTWGPQMLRKQPNLDGTCSLQTAGHTIFHETSQETKSRHFPSTQWWLSHGNEFTATEKFGLRCHLMKTVFCGVFLFVCG